MSESRLPTYGGQALIEGVLMRGTRSLAAAFRAPDGQVIIKSETLGGIYQSQIRKIPFLRGLIVLWDALGLGTRYLAVSANIQVKEEEKIEGPALYGTLALSLVIGVLIFVAIPSGLSQLLELNFGFGFWTNNIIEGFLRLFMAVGYIWAVGRMPEIARVFAYHGAEHKTINAFEDKAELTPEIVEKYPLEHPRCGTGFLLTVVVFSILIFSPLRALPFLIRILLQLVLVPPIACLAYEYMRWTANHLGNPVVKVLAKPGMLMQRLTTREPSRDMLEISITAFKTMYAMELQPVTGAVQASLPPNPPDGFVAPE